MKVTYLQQLPYRHFDGDFAARGHEPAVSTDFGLTEPALVHQDLQHAHDEMLHAVRAGFDAIALNEHSQSAYDMSPNPDLSAAILAQVIGSEDLDTGIYLVGRSLGKVREPLRVAEELAWLDNLSGGRLLAGFPIGLAYDANLNAGVPPIETRARYDENLALVLRAWTASEPFGWNGKYSQYLKVNVWPRPFQDPHPPVSITGIGNPNTTRFALERDLGFNVVSLGAGIDAQRILDDLWRMAAELNLDDNPFRVTVGQRVLVAGSDAEAERLYAEHVEYHLKCGVPAVPVKYLALPGGISPQGLRALFGSGMGGGSDTLPTFREQVESGALVAGSPATVREVLAERVRSYRGGNLLVQLQTGSMPTDLVKHNIDLFASSVLPELRGIWSEYAGANRWWPTRLGGLPVSACQSGLNGVKLT
ncbi:LLM class flavin-dependent oxidoreductase [Amycolatopsis jejuensis]|uniref:LLM class flavin-dependent oxidoreductase n=1 Tax=Amycolatopsis jejuensis TaxID=330084 RepID=UPI00052536CE|nr:LLM class flavin-dependent oxidoreductase [Amycolatopsis jejuensis]